MMDVPSVDAMWLEETCILALLSVTQQPLNWHLIYFPNDPYSSSTLPSQWL